MAHAKQVEIRRGPLRSKKEAVLSVTHLGGWTPLHSEQSQMFWWSHPQSRWLALHPSERNCNKSDVQRGSREGVTWTMAAEHTSAFYNCSYVLLRAVGITQTECTSDREGDHSVHEWWKSSREGVTQTVTAEQTVAIIYLNKNMHIT